MKKFITSGICLFLALSANLIAEEMLPCKECYNLIKQERNKIYYKFALVCNYFEDPITDLNQYFYIKGQLDAYDNCLDIILSNQD